MRPAGCWFQHNELEFSATRKSALGLGRVETHWIQVPESMGAKKRLHFLGPHYALIAAMSGWIPMMFITRVRL